MNRFDTKIESLKFLELQKQFLKKVVNINCSWGIKRDGILQAMRARNFNYSVKTETPNIIEYTYNDNFENSLQGKIILQ